jgi:hypothetical protein
MSPSPAPSPAAGSEDDIMANRGRGMREEKAMEARTAPAVCCGVVTWLVHSVPPKDSTGMEFFFYFNFFIIIILKNIFFQIWHFLVAQSIAIYEL